MEEVSAAIPLEIEQCVIRNTAQVRRFLTTLWWNGKVFELLAEDNNCLLRQERVLRWGRAKVRRRRAAFKELLLRREEAAWVVRGAVELVASMLEEVEDVVEAVWVELVEENGSANGVGNASEVRHVTALTSTA